jgi:hypothetical protein
VLIADPLQRQHGAQPNAAAESRMGAVADRHVAGVRIEQRQLQGLRQIDGEETEWQEAGRGGGIGGLGRRVGPALLRDRRRREGPQAVRNAQNQVAGRAVLGESGGGGQEGEGRGQLGEGAAYKGAFVGRAPGTGPLRNI